VSLWVRAIRPVQASLDWSLQHEHLRRNIRRQLTVGEEWEDAAPGHRLDRLDQVCAHGAVELPAHLERGVRAALFIS
jgi:hypothetical protein